MKNYPSSKKGQIQTLAPMIMVLIFAGITLVLGLVISQELTDTVNDVTITITDSELGFLNATGYTLDASTVCNFNAPAITVAENLTGGVIPAANYTVNATGTVLNATAWTSISVTFNYTYNWGDEACEAGNQTVVGLGTFADFWEIIILAIVITIVIGLLLVVFGGRRER